MQKMKTNVKNGRKMLFVNRSSVWERNNEEVSLGLKIGERLQGSRKCITKPILFSISASFLLL